jgi:thioredoxin reductase (NADPH)
MKAQAVRWGSELVTEDVTYVDLQQRPFTIRSEEREVKAHSIAIATGANAKRLHLPSEDKFWNKGISACAICDGASPIFKNAELVVIGGGDTAAEESVYLTKYGSHVHLLVRRNQMRASKTMQDRVLNHSKITVHWNTEAVDVFGTEGKQMEGVKVKNNQTGEKREIAAQGLFYAIGHTPNTQLFQGQLELDEKGYIITRNNVETNIEGVYAVGDVQDYLFRQAVTAASSGCMGAMLAERWLMEKGLAQEFHQSSEQMETPSYEKSEKSAADTEETFDPNATFHRGSYAIRKLYHESDRLIMVRYVAPTCGPCHALKPILDKVVKEFNDRMYCVEIDIDAEPQIAVGAGVTGTPTVQFFKNKQLLAEMKGVKPKSQYRELIANHV